MWGELQVEVLGSGVYPAVDRAAVAGEVSGAVRSAWRGTSG